MRLTKTGKDYIVIDECNMADPTYTRISKVHLIKLAFKLPTLEKVNYIFNTFPATNRFVVEDNIKFYNDIIRNTNKKYYVVNKEGDALISFYKKNNKVLLDVSKLSILEKSFVFSIALDDILSLTEVMIVSEKQYMDNQAVFTKWSGNLIVQ